jgi:hypothetical protein
MSRPDLRKKEGVQGIEGLRDEPPENAPQKDVVRESVGTASRRDVSPNTPRGEPI